MSRGGYRPGAGRKPGSPNKKPRAKTKAKTMPKAPKRPRQPKPSTSPPPPPSDDQKIREMLAFDKKAKAKFYNEFLFRVSKGEPLTLAEKKMMGNIAAELAADLVPPEGEGGAEPKAEPLEDLTPLEFMLRVMNNPREDKEFRARMAQAAAPYVHARKGEGVGKKEEKADRAKTAGAGKFASGVPPLKMVKS